MKKLFTRQTHYMIAAFILAAMAMLAFCERADSAEHALEHWHDSTAGISPFNDGLDHIGHRSTFQTGTSIYVSPIVAVGGDIDEGSFVIGFGQRFFDRFQGQLHLLYFEDEPYGGVSIRRYIGDYRFKLAIGGSYWINESPGSDSDVTFNLGISYTWH